MGNKGFAPPNGKQAAVNKEAEEWKENNKQGTPANEIRL